MVSVISGRPTYTALSESISGRFMVLRETLFRSSKVKSCLAASDMTTFSRRSLKPLATRRFAMKDMRTGLRHSKGPTEQRFRSLYNTATALLGSLPR
jgi:hypothetical protein